MTLHRTILVRREAVQHIACVRDVLCLEGVELTIEDVRGKSGHGLVEYRGVGV